MTTVLIVIHLMVVLALIGLVLLQRSEGGALGIGGGGAGFMTGRGAGNVLTKSTAILAAAFFLTSIGLALLAKMESRPSDILERLPSQTPPATESETPAPPSPDGTSPSVEDILEQLRNAPTGTDTPPAGSDAPAAPASETPAPAPETRPAPTGDAAPGPQSPPAQ